MDVIEYSYKASDLILKEIYNRTTDNELKRILENYADISKDIDISWSLISTGLLISENIVEDMPSYDTIQRKTISLLEDYWNNYEDYNFEIDYFDEDQDSNDYYIKTQNYCLDKNNKKTIELNSLEDFLYGIEYNKYYYDLVNQEDEKMIEKTKSISSILTKSGSYIDFKKLKYRIRCALAHSEYEINNGSLHLFHKTNNEYDLNINLDKNSIIFIIDDLSETANDFKDNDIYHSFKNKDYLGTYDNIIRKYKNDEDFSNLSDEKIIKIFDDLKIPKKIIIDALESAKKQYEHWDEPELETIENDEDDEYFYLDGFQKISDVLFKIVELKPTTLSMVDIGNIINNYVYDDENDPNYKLFKNKKQEYYYLDLKTYKQKNNPTYNNELLKLLVLSYINSTIGNNYNSLQNSDNNERINIKIENIKIQKDILQSIKKRFSEKKQNLMGETRKKLISVKKNYQKLNGSRRLNRKRMTFNYQDNNFFNEILPKVLIKQKENLKNLYKEKIEVERRMSEIENMSLYDELNMYIIKSIRNSISHGHIDFYCNNLTADTEIVIKDFDEEGNTTFNGIIKVKDLLLSIIKSKEELYKKNKSINKTIK